MYIFQIQNCCLLPGFEPRSPGFLGKRETTTPRETVDASPPAKTLALRLVRTNFSLVEMANSREFNTMLFLLISNMNKNDLSLDWHQASEYDKFLVVVIVTNILPVEKGKLGHLIGCHLPAVEKRIIIQWMVK